MRRASCWLPLAAICASAAPGAPPSPSALSDRSGLALEEPASRAFLSDAFLDVTVPALRAEAERILRADPSQAGGKRRELETGLVAVAILQGRAGEAERRIADLRRKEEKAPLRAVALLTEEAVAAGLQARPERRCGAMAARVAQRLRSADPAVVREEALLRLGQVEKVSPAYLASALVATVDPSVTQTGTVELSEGLLMARLRLAATFVPPCRSDLAAAYRRWLSEPGSAPVEIWRSREPRIPPGTVPARVAVAVWDNGIDTSLFAGRMAIDPAEPLDGRDNDGNGIVDDVHGPTFDGSVRPSAHPLPPPSPFLAPWLALAMALDKGERDLGYGLDTEEARLFAARAREASLEQQNRDYDASAEIAYRGHGTAVASTIADGAPFVSLYNLRLFPGGYDPKPLPRSEAEFDRFEAALPAAIARARGAGVRIVNLSWLFTVDVIADRMLATGRETDRASAWRRAQAISAKLREALRKAIAGAPEMLFVAAAGNENESDAALSAIPQSLDLPNLLVVGAVGLSGQPTAFTTFGPSVGLYAQGEGTPGRTPGGMADRWSGTSMAAPLVSRTAAWMLAVNPKLKPAELAALMKSTATPGEGGMRLIHPAAAVELAQQARSGGADRR